ncbi:MAG: hypothetical protein A2283_07155 [Lentisphaerae bacterium RIFOXYA12_FULL_48_11]|nr:MAG: hypothetical protein A2283_07155 [Lentisphaerae bacterium RIFOXYA12_FULL_48_11]
MTSDVLSQLKVLLVEDESLVRWTGRKALEGMGCLVIEAGNCFDAEEAWKCDDFDLIVLDYRLPDGVSMDVVERMRSKGSEVPLVYLTAETEKIGEIDAARLGIRRVLKKPLNVEELKNAVLEFTGLKSDNENTEGHISEGGFEVVICPAVIEESTVVHICGQSELSSWIALCMDKTESIDDVAIRRLQEMSAEKRGSGGRLCIVGLSPKMRDYFVKLEVDRQIDLLSGLDELRHLGRKTTSPSERMSLMDVAVRSDNAGAR